jgi:hypothetical protein
LTISYHDEEFMPTEDRQALLSSRGFTCQCPLCSGAIPDRARAAVCSGCKLGVCSPLLVNDTSSWKCDRCTGILSAQEADAVVNAEEEWLVQWPALIETVESGKTPSIKSQPYRLLRSLADMTRKTRIRPSTMLVAMPDAEKVVAPLCVCHGHVYTLLKWALFQQSVWLRTQLGRDGIVGALFAMAAIVERSLGADAASEERRVLGYWVAKEAVEVGVDPRGRPHPMAGGHAFVVRSCDRRMNLPSLSLFTRVICYWCQFMLFPQSLVSLCTPIQVEESELLLMICVNI